jgi:hypothetical protein
MKYINCVINLILCNEYRKENMLTGNKNRHVSIILTSEPYSKVILRNISELMVGFNEDVLSVSN